MSLNLSFLGEIFKVHSRSVVLRELALACHKLGHEVYLLPEDGIPPKDSFTEYHQFIKKPTANSILIRYNEPAHHWVYELFQKSYLVCSCEYAYSADLPPEINYLANSGLSIKNLREYAKNVSYVPHGVNPDIFSFEGNKLDFGEGYKFLHLVGTNAQVGSDLVFTAFIDEFKENEKVKLVIKDNFYSFNNQGYIANFRHKGYSVFTHPNIIYHYGNVLPEETSRYYRSCDCFVFPVRSTSFGMTLAEAMACGMPYIVTKYSGPMDYAECNLDCTVKKGPRYGWVQSDGFRWFIDRERVEDGEYAEPDYEQLKALMRQAFEEKWTRSFNPGFIQQWSWEQAAQKLIAVLEENK